MEAHGPYVPETKSIFKNDSIFIKDNRKIDRTSDFVYQEKKESLDTPYAPIYSLFNVKKNNTGKIIDFNRNVNEYIAHYDMGIYILDKELGNFFNIFKKIGLFDKSKLIITADHGELLGEDNLFFTHGVYASPVLSNVPLIIKEPYQKDKKIINSNFSLVNIVRTIVGIKNYKKILSFHPKSIGIVKGNVYRFIHKGNFNNKVDLEDEELIFPIKKTDKDFLIKRLKRSNKVFEYFFKKNNEFYKQSGISKNAVLSNYLNNLIIS